MKDRILPRELVNFLLVASDKLNNTIFRVPNAPADLIAFHNMFRLSASEFMSTKQHSYELQQEHVPYVCWLMEASLILAAGNLIEFDMDEMRRTLKAIEYYEDSQ